MLKCIAQLNQWARETGITEVRLIFERFLRTNVKQWYSHP